MLKIIALVFAWGISILMFKQFLNFSNELSVFIFIIGIMMILRFRKSLFVNIFPPTLLFALLAYVATIQASNDHNWRSEVSKLAKIEINNHIASIQNLRSFQWHDADKATSNWLTRNYDLNSLVELNLIIEPFKDSQYMAHAMLDFDFGDQGHVIVSVEARKEQDEEYGLIAGAIRQFELIYIFGDEQDLLGLRAIGRKSTLHLYPIKAEPSFIISLFKDLANSANKLHDEPTFYRTLRDNCTTTLVKHIDRQYKQHIGLRMETIFPAKAGELLYKLDRMDTNLAYPQVYEASRIDHLVRNYWGQEDFSSKLHAAVETAYLAK